eukprot:jgi/Botrbrau1/2261/Bobra.101_2s0085.1
MFGKAQWCTALCSNGGIMWVSVKQGTLTLNKLSVNRDDVFCVSGRPLKEVLMFTALSADLKSEEPIDVVCHESYPDNATLWDNWTMLKYVPFNPVDKFTMDIVKENKTGKIYRVVKGAPQVVLKKARNMLDIEDAVNGKITEFAGRGFRSLGVAVAEAEIGDNWEMVAVVPMFDPPRHDTKETIERCIEKGISVKMVTGDQLLIGKETARQLGMGTNMYTTDVLLKAKEGKIEIPGHSGDVEELVEAADGFAEVFPEHKYEIVEMLQRRRHLVAMTGDGVNDAPALKKADVGIAVAACVRGPCVPPHSARVFFLWAGTLLGVFGYFPTLLIVLLAVFNDGAMIALSKDRVVASHCPNRWTLPAIFSTGIVYGLYLTLATWILVLDRHQVGLFRKARIHMHSLNDRDDVLEGWCLKSITGKGLSPTADGCTAGPAYKEAISGCPWIVCKWPRCADPSAWQSRLRPPEPAPSSHLQLCARLSSFQ